MNYKPTTMSKNQL